MPYELVLLSSHPLELCELPRQCTMRHTGSWGDGTSGGSNLHSSWLQNPALHAAAGAQDTLQVSAPTHLKLVRIRLFNVVCGHQPRAHQTDCPAPELQGCAASSHCLLHAVS